MLRHSELRDRNRSIPRRIRTESDGCRLLLCSSGITKLRPIQLSGCTVSGDARRLRRACRCRQTRIGDDRNARATRNCFGVGAIRICCPPVDRFIARIVTNPATVPVETTGAVASSVPAGIVNRRRCSPLENRTRGSARLMAGSNDPVSGSVLSTNSPCTGRL